MKINGDVGEDDEAFVKIITNDATSRAIIETTNNYQVDFIQPGKFRELLGFNERLLTSVRNTLNKVVVILSTSNSFINCSFANGMIIKSDKSGIIHNWTVDVNSGWLYVGNFRGETIWHDLIQTYQIISMTFKLVDEDKKNCSGDNVVFTISIQEI